MIPLVAFASLIVSCPAADANPRWTGVGVTQVERFARRGDKSAQLELGQRFRLGNGVPRDLRAAKRWYRRAERTTTVRNFVYSGPVGTEKHGRALPVGDAAGEIGLPQATACLSAMEVRQ